ncbi:type IV secretory system conjugative DNA transfer family protein [Actinomadura mexicana]|uniref:TraM recognition site of TraD and TraG n=1 Tax=Actinomadura mexicana TaxID=134959 RepID=A0A239BZZ9_9ACTN|nr:type IV secretion system DNA-binding domain-containing protein [Actinomadura mexicana]SNS13001.1 TraM recognition site of TraD and TraG [Actinomadura mexicana]
MTESTEQAPATSDHLLRLAAVQLDYIPNMRTRQADYWLPDEPLIGIKSIPVESDDTALNDLDLGDEFEDQTDTAVSVIRRARHRSSELKLKQILEFCSDHQVDVVVFPECSVSAELIHVLTGYRNELTIFAGVGQLREMDAAILADQGFSAATEALGCNSAVFVSKDRLALVTKADHAQGEYIERGEGPVRVSLSKGERRYDVGLAICMDYVNIRRDFDGQDRPPDLVLTTALSSPTEDFLKRPRNFATVFSNHAQFGGSAVLAPDVAGIFVDRTLGTEPLPPGESIVVADFTGFQQRPKRTKTPQNRIHLRAAILYEDAETSDASGTISGLARPMHNWSLEQYNAGRYREFLSTAEERLEEMRPPAVLLEAVKRLRRRQKRQVFLESDLLLLTTHLILSNVKSEPELRYAALTTLHEHWHPLLGKIETAGLGGLTDKLNVARRQLESQIRPEYQQITPPTRRPLRNSEAETEFTVFYAARLGQYNVDRAVQSLPRQLGVLRTLSLLNDESVRLLYRVSTARQTTGNLAPFFDIVALTESNDPDVIDDLAEGIGQQLGVAFSNGWDILATTASSSLNTPFLVELRPRANTVPLIQEDWGGLIDYLRALKPQISVQLVCRRAPEAAREPTGGPSPSLTLSGTGFVGDHDGVVAPFLSRASNEEADPANLALQIHVGADETLGDSVLRSIGLWLFRGVPFDIVSDESARSALLPNGPLPDSTTPLTPAEALRIFHPPHGRMEGRGLSHGVPRAISLPDVAVLAEGISLGTARSSQARHDQRVDVRFAEEARLRHTYIVGRTGSGKTNMLKLMAMQDIREGRAVAVIDPHGDLVDFLLGHTAGRDDEVLFLDFGDPDYLPVLNPLDLDVHGMADLELAIEEFIQLIERQSFHEFYGPRFEEIVRLALESITNDDYPIKPPSVIDLVRVLRSKERRTWIRNILTDPDLKERWGVFEQQRDDAIGEVLHWTLSKFSEMQQDGVLGQVLTGGSSTVSIEDCVGRGGILLVKIPEWEMSKSAARMLGSFIQERIRKAVYGRWRQNRNKSDPIYMYVDEFQAFAVTGFDEIVAEARKFGLGLILAHQNVGQLKSFSRFTGAVADNLMSAILGNVANRILFGVSNHDANLLAAEFDVEPQVLRSPGNYQAITQLLYNGEAHTFTLQPPKADADAGLPAGRATVRRRMIEGGAWRSRDGLRAEDEEREKRTRAAVRDSKPTPKERDKSENSFLDEWLEKRKNVQDQEELVGEEDGDAGGEVISSD